MPATMARLVIRIGRKRLRAPSTAASAAESKAGVPPADLEQKRRAYRDSKRLAYVAEAPVWWCEQLGTVLANAGRQTLDGHTALNYVRARQVTTEVNGDYGRIKRQQLFLSSLLRSIISKDTLFSLNNLAVSYDGLGKHAQAYEYSLHASRLDLDDYNRNTADGLHTTSMAAAWLNMVYGFGGMRSDGPMLSFNPSIPKKWKQFAFRILYKGCVLGVTVDKKNVSFRATPAAGQAGGEGVLIEVFGRRCFVDDKGVSVPLPANRRA